MAFASFVADAAIALQCIPQRDRRFFARSFLAELHLPQR